MNYHVIFDNTVSRISIVSCQIRAEGKFNYDKIRDSAQLYNSPIFMVFNPLGSGGCLNKKDGLTRYGDSHVKDKTS